MKLQKPLKRNSAGRLLWLFSSYPQGHPLVNFLPELMTGNPGKTQAEKYQICYDSLVEIHELYRQFQQDMENASISDEQRKTILSNLQNLEELVYPGALTNNIRPLGETEKSVLQIAATFIEEEDELEKEDIDEIRESIAALRSLVEGSDVSPTLRKTLLELIRLADDAISRFNIHGARGLKRAFKAMLVEAMDLHSSENAKELENSGIWQKIRDLILKMGRVADRILKHRDLIEKAKEWLLTGPGQQPPI
jgi:hypothetical protein